MISINYLIYTDKGAQECTKLEVFFIVQQRQEPGGLCEQMSERRRDPQAALNQVADTEHSDKTL